SIFIFFNAGALPPDEPGGLDMKAATISTTGNEARASTAGDEATASGDEATAWHALAADDEVRRLDTDTEKGLEDAAISHRLKKFGPNRLPEARRRGPFVRFLLQFNNVLVYVLLAAAFTKLMLSLWLDASIILGVVVINALLGFFQEGRAEKALDSIRHMLSTGARAVRGG